MVPINSAQQWLLMWWSVSSRWTAVNADVMTCILQAAALKFLSSTNRTISYAIGCQISHPTFNIGINSIKKLSEAKQPGFHVLIKIFLWLEVQISVFKDQM